MSGELLREAATAIRDEWADGNEPMGTAWHRERDFHRAVADWLHACATVLDVKPSAAKAHAVKVARAYLGRPA